MIVQVKESMELIALLKSKQSRYTLLCLNNDNVKYFESEAFNKSY